ncbi:MAG TPA: hypothetical protein VF338_07695 [Leptolinea sp.]
MSGRSQPRSGSTAEQRKRRTQQIVFNLLAIIVILSWIISLVAK